MIDMDFIQISTIYDISNVNFFIRSDLRKKLP
jgi:hypothetical protein